MKTALYERHVALGAKIVEFAGWEMPLQYEGILAEHQAVRQAVGLFDVSHMGFIEVSGSDAEQFLDFLSTNTISGKAPGTAIYTVWCNEKGGSVDDVMVFKVSTDHFFIIVNAGNREKDLLHLTTQAANLHKDVQIKEHYSGRGILALQGPSAELLLANLLPEAAALKPMHFLCLKNGAYLSRTGYTGAGGFEMHAPIDQILTWWDTFLDKGQAFGIKPIGLGARDTLRLEAGFALYGHELSDTIAPIESVSAWTVKWDKPDFLGKKALEQLEPLRRHPFGLRMLEGGIPRQGCKVFKKEKEIGAVTSGSYSPTLETGIALILASEPLQLGEKVMIHIRQTQYPAIVAEIPFVRKTG